MYIIKVVPELCLRNEQLELILGTPVNQVWLWLFGKVFYGQIAQVITGIQNVYRTIKNVELTYCDEVIVDLDKFFAK